MRSCHRSLVSLLLLATATFTVAEGTANARSGTFNFGRCTVNASNAVISVSPGFYERGFSTSSDTDCTSVQSNICNTLAGGSGGSCFSIANTDESYPFSVSFTGSYNVNYAYSQHRGLGYTTGWGSGVLLLP